LVEFDAPRPPPDFAVVEASSLPHQERPDAEPSGSAFGAPRELAGGRGRLYGFSPGCLIGGFVLSVLVNRILTVLVTVF
jgi:hypothetical protein